MRGTQRTLMRVWSVLTVAVITAAGATTSAPAATGAAHPLAGQLLGVWCTSATSCMAVGSARGPAFSASLLADRWNGATWSVVPVPKPPHAHGGVLASVACTSPSACMAVGSYATRHAFKPLAEGWNGTGWAIEPTPGVSS